MARQTPCDNGPCPYDDGSIVYRMYFCRDNCGLGVDENEVSEEDNDNEDV